MRSKGNQLADDAPQDIGLFGAPKLLTLKIIPILWTSSASSRVIKERTDFNKGVCQAQSSTTDKRLVAYAHPWGVESEQVIEQSQCFRKVKVSAGVNDASI